MTAEGPEAPLARAPRIPEIQALRAVAVAAVVVYHVWPRALPGGFAGVDVFFVISGFLITSHIRSQVLDGRFSFAAFYARRIRRLLPTAFLVILAAMIITLTLVSHAMWGTFIPEFIAAGGYVENWLLAHNAVDYLAATNQPSPVQHFWSLAVEEQFYLVWPALLVGAFVLFRRRRQAMTVVLALVFVVSLIVSIRMTATSPEVAFFATQTRAWEFAAGGLVSVLATTGIGRSRVLDAVRSPLVSTAGIVAIAASFVVLDASTPFPGAAALLPVAGAAVVLAALAPQNWFRSAAGLRPLQQLGDMSYSVYLWHWPLIIFWPYFVGREPGLGGGVIIVVLTLALGYLSWRFVERPAQRARWWSRRALKPFAVAVLGAILIAAIGGAGLRVGDSEVATVADRVHLLQGTECFGALAAVDRDACGDIYAATPTVSRLFATQDLGIGIGIGTCESAGGPMIDPCVFGDTVDPSLNVALVGDSHAGQMIEGLAAAATDRGWRLQTFVRAACPGLGSTTQTIDTDCSAWGDEVRATIIADPTIDVVVMTNATAKYVTDPRSLLHVEAAENDLAALRDAGKTVLVIRDPPGGIRETPTTTPFNPSQCLVTSAVIANCAIARDRLVFDDVMVTAASAVPGVTLIDLSDIFCDDTRCYPVVGGLDVYVDGGHLTKSFSTSLGPVLGDRIASALAR